MSTQPANDHTSALLTVTEAAEMLRVSRWMLYRLIHSQQLRTIKLGSRRLVPRAAIDELLASPDQQERP